MVLAVCVSGCATPIPTASEIVAPKPILDNTGEYMSPFTQDGTLTPWVDKAINVKLASTVGGTIGSMAAQQAMSQVPFIGGILGDKVGTAVGRGIAMQAIGGEDYIKRTSDTSFHSLSDLAVYVYVKNSSHPQYQDALEATMAIYPDLKDQYQQALESAPRRDTTLALDSSSTK